MSKRTRIFLVSIAAILVAATLLFVLVNNSLVSPYYVHRQKQVVRKVGSELAQHTVVLENYIPYVEQNTGVVVAVVPITPDIDLLNSRLREAFLAKGLGLSRYWLWQEDYNSTLQNGSQQRIYSQGNLGYSLLVQYVLRGEQLLAVATVLPHLSRPLAVANTASALLMMGTAVLLMGLVWWMSNSLEKTQQRLEKKNEQMQRLLSNVSHDLKTPISLIKAYASGMRDGMDDGSFLDTIVQQGDRMELLTKRLLELSKSERTAVQREPVDVSDLLTQELEQLGPLFAAHELMVEHTIQAGVLVQSHPQSLATIAENLLTNAAKYASASPVHVSLSQQGTSYLLMVQNPTSLPEDTDIDRLWEPFFVAETSRNSALSGSGLGLPLVQAAAQVAGATCSCHIAKGCFCATLVLACQ